MLQFLLISAQDLIEFNYVSRCTYYLPTLHGVCCLLIVCNRVEKLGHLRPICCTGMYYLGFTQLKHCFSFHANWINIRSDIKSSGKFGIFRRLKIEGGRVKLVDYGKIETKDRNY